MFILGQISLGDFFDAIADGTGITRSKPHPEVFLKSAEELGVAPADCAVVEDARAGIEAAKAGGMTPLALFGDARVSGGTMSSPITLKNSAIAVLGRDGVTAIAVIIGPVGYCLGGVGYGVVEGAVGLVDDIAVVDNELAVIADDAIAAASDGGRAGLKNKFRRSKLGILWV